MRKDRAYKRGNVAVRPRNINWQDWKYTSFSIFITHSQNMRRSNAKDEYKPHDGRRRKHWIETTISKLIINPFSFTYILYRWIISLTKYMIASLLSLLFSINLNLIYNVYPASIFSVHFVNEAI